MAKMKGLRAYVEDRGTGRKPRLIIKEDGEIKERTALDMSVTEARAVAAEYNQSVKEIEDGAAVDAPLAFDSLCNWFRASELPGKSSGWAELIDCRLRRFEKRWGKRDVRSLYGKDVADYIKKRIQQRAGHGTIEGEVSVLRLLLNSAAEDRSMPLDANPVPEAMKLFRKLAKAKDVVKKELEIPSPEGVFAFLDWVKDRAPHVHAVIRFQAETGVRVGEALTLRRSALELDNCKASVIEHKDGKKPRVIEMPPQTAAWLRVWIDQCDQESGAYRRSGLVFTGQQWKPLTTGIFVHLLGHLKEAASEAEVTWMNSHAFRHHFASQALKGGFDRAWTARQLGHSVTMLERHYEKLIPADRDLSALATPGGAPVGAAAQSHAREGKTARARAAKRWAQA